MKSEKSSQWCTPVTGGNSGLREYLTPTISVHRATSIVHKLSRGPVADGVAGGRAQLSGGGLGTASGG